MELSSRQNHVISISAAFAISLFFYILHPMPNLLYSYDDKNHEILILNAGYYQATGVTIGINSNNNTIVHIQHSKIDGEPIINYTSTDNGILYYVPHMYSQDKITFTLIMKSNNASSLGITVHSNENQGTEMGQFFLNIISTLNVYIVIASIVLAVVVYLSVNSSLKRYVERFTREPKSI